MSNVIGQGLMLPAGPEPGAANTRLLSGLGMVLRSGLFLAALLLVWISVRPFQDISGTQTPGATSIGGDTLNQLAYLALAAGFALFLLFHGAEELRALFSPWLLVIGGWLVLTVILSQHPDLSARRFALVMIVTGIAVVMPLLPRDLNHFADMLAAAVLIVLALCYGGVLLAPHLAIHQASDPMESLAGNWRGVFSHKNTAGAMMALFIYIGFFVASVRNIAVGGLIVAASAVFLYFSEAKTAILVTPVIFLFIPILLAIPVTAVRIMICASLIAAMNLFTIGSVFIPGIADFLSTVMSDPTFTGRTYVWSFMRDHMPGHLLTGYGFSAFWNSPEIIYGPTEVPEFVPQLSSGHNSYLDMALTIGVPGALLVTGWLLAAPLLEVRRRPGTARERALVLLCLRIWMLGLILAGFETIMLQRDDTLWFMTVMSICTLRLMRVRQVKV